MKKEAYFATAKELEHLGPEAIPPQMISGKHLIYSSPATPHLLNLYYSSHDEYWNHLLPYKDSHP